MATAALETYTHDLEQEFATGIAKEHAYRKPLETLLESFSPNINAVNDPRHIEAGAPDFILLREDTYKRIPIAFVETKDIGVNLDRVERSEQLIRYRRQLPNLLLTDYLEFRWFVQGEKRESAILGQTRRSKILLFPDGANQVNYLLSKFIHNASPTVSNARDLAIYLADMARGIGDLALRVLPTSPVLAAHKTAFEQLLIPNLSDRQFADMYAQTLAYGLFAARMNYKGPSGTFVRKGVAEDIPRTNPFLRRYFSFLLEELDNRVEWMIDTMIELLSHIDTNNLLEGFGRRTRQEDPILHFYETFLSQYDPKLRESRGVYYTPEPIVNYIVASVDHALQEHFDRADGIADTDISILDPATGTGTFLHAVIQHIHEELVTKRGQGGVWGDYVQHRLLSRIFGFELLMAPYTVAHLKLGIQLQDLGYNFSSGQRLGIYLTNTLEEITPLGQHHLDIASFITDEANQATAIKQAKPIMVVLGNPPYSGHSDNSSDWIRELIRDYYHLDGKPLKEKNSKWLQDDYVKFIRFGQWRISRTGSGILAFITNNGYLDNPTFKGMRQQLLETFDDIYILNLHGNSKKQERTPTGDVDSNVFDIQQGTAIGIFIKKTSGKTHARLHYADLWGKRDLKYTFLAKNSMASTTWTEIRPQKPSYLFIPQDEVARELYENGWQLTDIMPEKVMGFQTHRDQVAVAFDDTALFEQVTQYLGDNPSEENWRQFCSEVDYRPFDRRVAYLHKSVTDRPRPELLQHVVGKDNLCLNTVRQTKLHKWQHVLVSKKSTPAVYLEIKDGSTVFPLYLYPLGNELFDPSPYPLSEKGRRPNISSTFVEAVQDSIQLDFVTEGCGNLAETFGPEDIFHYIYSILFSAVYKKRYSSLLTLDFPRIPLPVDVSLFRQLCQFGNYLTALHAEKIKPIHTNVRFPQSGSNRVEASFPIYDNLSVYINAEQSFDGISEEAWEFKIGGYQVLEKWLKDRRERQLTYTDVLHYQQIVYVIEETLRTIMQIDTVFADHLFP